MTLVCSDPIYGSTMVKSPFRVSRRRALLSGLAALAVPAVARAQEPPPLVTVLGDSITAGLGLAADLAMPARLQAALDRMGVHSRVYGFGVMGDTSAAGLSRVDRAPVDTRVCVVALGGNDLLLGLDPGTTRANLRAIILRLKARGVRVVLAGMRAPALLGVDYARRFTQLYPELARELDVLYAPDFFTGVIGVSRYMQRDGLHPNAEGARIIAERLAPIVARALGA